MKKALLLLSFLLFSFLADANPLFFPNCSSIIIKDKYEYFYDSYGNLIGCEEIGSSGSVYCYLGEGQWEEDGYFIEENGWCLYYCTWLDNKYVGKGKADGEIFKDGDDYYSKLSMFYVDEKNRPIATYNETLSGQFGESLKTIFGSLDPLGILLNGGKTVERRILVLKGNVRLYDD